MKINKLLEAVNNLKIRVAPPEVMKDHLKLFTPNDWKEVAVNGFGQVAGDKFGISIVGGELVNDEFVLLIDERTPTVGYMSALTYLYDQWSKQTFTLSELFELTHLSNTPNAVVALIDKSKNFKAYENAVMVAINNDSSVRVQLTDLRYDRNNHTIVVDPESDLSGFDYEALVNKLTELCGLTGNTPVSPAFKAVLTKLAKLVGDKIPGVNPTSFLNLVIINSLSKEAKKKMEEAGIDFSSYSKMLLGLGLTEKEFQVVKAYLNVDDNGEDL